MKHLRNVLALVLAAVVALIVAAPAFAQDVASGMGGDATITIENASKGDTYKVVKLFDATITNPASDKIAYTGNIPSALANYFEKDSAGNVTLKKIADSNGKNPGDEGYVETFYTLTADDFAAMKTWADGVAADNTDYPNKSAESDGSTLNFTGLKYGYYVICSTQGALVTVDSTNKDVTVRDKNTKTPSANKDVEPAHVSVGDKVTYTATFDAPNYLEKAGKSEQVVSYIIKDTLPSFLGDVKITSVKVVHTPAVAEVADDPDTPEDEHVDAVAEVATDLSSQYTAFTNKQIEIPWVNETVPTQDHKYTSKYKNGSQIVITYEATVTADANVGKGNVNEVELVPQVDRGDGKEPYDENQRWRDDATIYTHAAALQKKANAENGDNLAGAEFSFKGLVVSGEPGFYTVVAYDKSANAADGTIMKCDANGKLVIAGIDADSTTPVTLVGKETKAPDGFNKLEGTFNLNTIVMSSETTTTHGEKTTYYDADGNIVDEQASSSTSISRNEITALSDIPATSIQKVVNKQGTELPSTGGMGTTILYTIGGIMLVGGAVALVSKKRLANMEK